MTPKAQIEAELVGRMRVLMEVAGISVLTSDNPDLVGPIGRAIRTLGGTQATLGKLTQADLDTLPADTLEALLDVSQLHTLEAIQAAFTSDSHIKELDYEERSGERVAAIGKLIDALRARIATLYGLGVKRTFKAGVVDLNISARRCRTEFA